MCNSDLAMLQFFLRFLRESLSVEESRIKLAINCHLGNGLDVEEIEQFWLDGLGLPRAALGKTLVNRASRSSKGRRPPLVYGTARLIVNSTWLLQHLLGAIQEHAAFERPAWHEPKGRTEFPTAPARSSTAARAPRVAPPAPS